MSLYGGWAMPNRDPFTLFLQKRRAYLRDSVWLVGGGLIAVAGVVAGSLHGAWRLLGLLPVTIVVIAFRSNWKR